MKMLINSQWVNASDNSTGEILNPGTGEVIDTVPQATLEDAQSCLEAAQLGREAMKKLPAYQRSEILHKIADLMEVEKESLSQLLARENGKPIAQTREEIGASIRIFHGFADEAKRIFGRHVPMEAIPGQEKHFAVVIRQPLGVVAAIVPFNYPVELYSHKAAAALAAGNAVIAKPPSNCPLTLLKLAEFIEKAGIPEAGHQMITGSGSVIGEYLAKSPGIQMVTVTGSTEVGIKISELAAKHLKKVHLELGGNDATIVCEDADLEKAAEAVVLGRLARGNGQICCAVKRIFVQTSVYDEDAVEKGAILQIGGGRENAFIEPTVLTNVPPEVELFKEETFGPVAPLVSFDTDDQAVAMANDSIYGLQAAVFTRDISRALDMGYKLEAGGVIINWSSALRVETLPFGGVKMSGHGREGVHDTLNEMTEQKVIFVHDALSVFNGE
jgi:lactaldehyde dehydrogenase